jgi:hypothetical protein
MKPHAYPGEDKRSRHVRVSLQLTDIHAFYPSFHDLIGIAEHENSLIVFLHLSIIQLDNMIGSFAIMLNVSHPMCIAVKEDNSR